jgi:quercetin dioxygenase-like cupin family protein
MRRTFIVSLLLVFAAAAGSAQHHSVTTPSDVKWGAAPPSLPAGAQFALLDGDPTKPGAFTIRLKFPDGYKIPPHWHPTDEHLTIVQGVFRVGVGEKLTESVLHDMAVGSFAKMPAKTPHFAVAQGETIVQVHGQGPFVLNYVNAADDPRKKTQD